MVILCTVGSQFFPGSENANEKGRKPILAEKRPKNYQKQSKSVVSAQYAVIGILVKFSSISHKLTLFAPGGGGAHCVPPSGFLKSVKNWDGIKARFFATFSYI